MKYIALLRGINVGGHRKILMKDLKTLLSYRGLSDIQTYIQSGNIVMTSTKNGSKELEKMITEMIENEYGYDVPVVVLTQKEWNESIELNPFYLENSDISQLHVTILHNKPEEKRRLEFEQKIEKFEDDAQISDKFVFLKIPGSYHKSKLNNNFIENQLKVSATTRNWKTVLKLNEMLNIG